MAVAKRNTPQVLGPVFLGWSFSIIHITTRMQGKTGRVAYLGVAQITAGWEGQI